MSPRVLALVPARGGSKGLPGKNCRLLAGRPLLAYAVDAALRSGVVDRVVLSTESQSIAEIGRQCGAEVPFLRPAEFATDTAAKIHAIRHATEYAEQHEAFQPDFVLDLDIGVPCAAQTTSPRPSSVLRRGTSTPL